MTLTVYVLLGMIAVQQCTITVQQLLHHKERRDLYTRLMSNNLSDYKNYQNKDTRKPAISAHSKVLKKWRDRGGGE